MKLEIVNKKDCGGDIPQNFIYLYLNTAARQPIKTADYDKFKLERGYIV